MFLSSKANSQYHVMIGHFIEGSWHCLDWRDWLVNKTYYNFYNQKWVQNLNFRNVGTEG